ncbi:MAG: SDR family oxidoreductase [bacterium]|nr:SDR family oxidoreductase [bacterium]
MTNRLSGKRCLVTGAGSGIARAIASRFVAEGAVVVGCDRAIPADLDVATLGYRIDLCDVSDAAGVAAWVDQGATDLGGIDVVVAAAGYELLGDALELTIEDWDKHQSVMLRGVFVTFRSAVPHMIEAGGGSLIAIGSNLSFSAIPRFTSYLAAKAGVVGLTRGMAVDFAKHGIRANALCPGPTLTPLIERQLAIADDPGAALAMWAGDTILNRLGRPEEIAAGAVFLASDEASYVTGSALMIDGGYTAK